MLSETPELEAFVTRVNEMIEERVIEDWDNLLDFIKDSFELLQKTEEQEEDVPYSVVDPDDQYLEYQEPTNEDWDRIIFPTISAYLRKDLFLKPFEIEEWIRRIDVKCKEKGPSAAVEMFNDTILQGATIPKEIVKFVSRKSFGQSDEPFYANNGPTGASLTLKKYMYTQLKDFQRNRSKGIEVKSYTDNFNWTVAFTRFDDSSNLGQGLMQLALIEEENDLSKGPNSSFLRPRHIFRSNKIEPSEIICEIRFPYDFPESAPLFRLITPFFINLTEGFFKSEIERFMFSQKSNHNGMQIETTESRLSDISITDMITSIRDSLVTKDPEIDLKSATFGNTTVSNAWYVLGAKAATNEYADVESTGRIYLPSSILSDVYSNSMVNMRASSSSSSPMIFEIYNPINDKRAYCGILEFTAPEGTMIAPSWVRASVGLAENQQVEVRRVALPMCTFIKIKSYLPDNLDKSFNIKAMLEWKLRDFMALSINQNLVFNERGHHFKFEVIEVRPGHQAAITDSDITLELITENDKPSLDNAEVEEEKQPEESTQGLTSGYVDDGVESKQCDSCLARIPLANFTLHSLTCRVSNFKCDKCGAVIQKSEKDKHDEEVHAIVPCKKCGKGVEKRFLNNHEMNECESRLVNCQYCEMTLPFSQVESHEASCGNITEVCEQCNARIMRKHRIGHMELGCDLSGRLNMDDKNQYVDLGNNNPPPMPPLGGNLTRSIFVCEKCQQPIEGFDELQVHYLTVHGDEEQNIADNETSEKDNNKTVIE